MVVVSIATLYERKKSLLNLIESLLPQVDLINIYAHDYLPEHTPLFNNYKVNIAYSYEFGDCGDLDKFFWISQYKEGYHFILDDDLIVPDTYIQDSIKIIEKNPDYIYSYHGADIYKPPIGHYYKDRIVYSCLKTVPNDIDNPSIISTGVLFFDSSRFNFEGLYNTSLKPNMADIHFSIFCHKKNYKTKIVAHQEGYIKHADINMNNTIFAQNFSSPYNMTKTINDNADLFKDKCIDYKPEKPLVTVVVVNTRLKTNPEYLSECLDSIRKQYYDNIELILLDNEDKLITVGRAFNKATEMAKGKYILYIGDDDYISPDYVASLVSTIDIYSDDPTVAGVSSYLTLFRRVNEQYYEEKRTLIPTGMWKREIVLKERFKEYITRYVDSEFIERMKSKNYKQLIANNQYGYYYRSHTNQISGLKVFTNENGQNVDQNKILTTIENYTTEGV